MSAPPVARRVVLDPGCRFEEIAGWIEGGGWHRATAPALPPLFPGEPEAAAWVWPGTSCVRVVYSYNPVIRLRSLDLTAVPASWRRVIVQGLVPLGVDDLLARLSGDRRSRLLAVHGLTEIEAVEALPRLAERREDRELRAALEQAIEALARISVAQELAKTSAGTLATAVADALPEALAPDLDLLDALLADEVIPGVRAAYAAPPDRPRVVGRPTVEPVPAFALRSPGRWASLLAPAWGDVAPWLVDGPVWCAARFGGTRIDGVVAWRGAVAWFPRLPRVLRDVVEARGIPLTTLSSWS